MFKDADTIRAISDFKFSENLDCYFETLHPAGTVLPLSSVVCNITARIGDRTHIC